MKKWWTLLRGRKVGAVQGALGLLLVFGACASPVGATPPFPTPELDPTALSGALTLLAGGVLILTAGRRRPR